MLIIGVLCLFLWFVVSIIVTGDMFRKNTPLGCLGVILLPILPFFWVLTFYSGKKKVVAPLLYGSIILGISILVSLWQSTREEIQPFIEVVEATVNVDISLSSIYQGSEGTKYVLLANPTELPNIEYTDINDMVDKYQEYYITPIEPYFDKLFPDKSDKYFLITIPTPSGFYVFYKIEYPGKMTKKGYSSGDDS